MLRRVAALSLIPVLSGACALNRAGETPAPVAEYAGEYVGTRGESWFRPCGGVPAARMWVTFTGSSVSRLERARSDGQLVDGRPGFLRLRATLTDERDVGPGGPALLVREILEIRDADSGDCGTVPGR